NVAHRGVSFYSPKNSILHYSLPEKMKRDYIQIVLQMTKDGHLVPRHDETWDRTPKGTGLAKDYTLKETKQLVAGSWFTEAYPGGAKTEKVGVKG
ncbi:glycerophosphodiester phosphodiesterase family protein, partial [Bacillus sp. GbtcB13]|uniref:glycerophosphodiester phosphodiesterase family protein n=1 Tax=Bacillus sp. GbtcB13 TaxID=2824758 RepID=UPI002671A9BD